MADYKGVLEDLKAKRAALKQECQRLDTAINALGPLVPTGLTLEGTGPRTFGGMNLPQALTKYAGLARQTATTYQVADALKAGGMKASVKSFRNQVYNVLRKLAEQDGGPWQRESDGRWRPRAAQPAKSDGA